MCPYTNDLLSYKFKTVLLKRTMSDLKQLHETDFNLLIEETIQTIKNRDLKNMDWDNVLDENEEMGESQKRALLSYKMRLIENIFKLKYFHK